MHRFLAKRLLIKDEEGQIIQVITIRTNSYLIAGYFCPWLLGRGIWDIEDYKILRLIELVLLYFFFPLERGV